MQRIITRANNSDEAEKQRGAGREGDGAGWEAGGAGREAGEGQGGGDTEHVKVPRSKDVNTERMESSMLTRASHLLGEFVKTDRWTHPAVLML